VQIDPTPPGDMTQGRLVSNFYETGFVFFVFDIDLPILSP
jgi:hypothetical protein